MKPIVSEKDFPTANKFVYLNAANVALMYNGAEKIITEWVADVAQNGSNNFDDHAEENDCKHYVRIIDKITNNPKTTIEDLKKLAPNRLFVERYFYKYEVPLKKTK